MAVEDPVRETAAAATAEEAEEMGMAAVKGQAVAVKSGRWAGGQEIRQAGSQVGRRAGGQVGR